MCRVAGGKALLLGRWVIIMITFFSIFVCGGYPLCSMHQQGDVVFISAGCLISVLLDVMSSQQEELDGQLRI
jgi:hypothetical protein